MPGWVDRQTARQTDSSKYLSARAWVATKRGASCQSISRAGEKPSPAAHPSPQPSPRAPRETGWGGKLVPSLQIPTRTHHLCPAASPTTVPAAMGCNIPSPASALGCPTPALLLGTKSYLQFGRGFAQSHPPHRKGRHPQSKGSAGSTSPVTMTPAMTFSESPERFPREAFPAGLFIDLFLARLGLIAEAARSLSSRDPEVPQRI